MLRQLIDDVEASIEEVNQRRLGGTPKFRKEDMVTMNHPKYTFQDFLSENRELGAIIEEENEE